MIAFYVGQDGGSGTVFCTSTVVSSQEEARRWLRKVSADTEPETYLLYGDDQQLEEHLYAGHLAEVLAKDKLKTGR